MPVTNDTPLPAGESRAGVSRVTLVLAAAPIVALLGLAAVRFAGRLPGAEERAFRAVLTRQFSRYPMALPQDVYKLSFQATMGGAHAAEDSAAAARWLDRELAELPPGPDEPVVDTISSDGRVVRVNLRPYVTGGGAPTALLEAFLRSAREMPASKESLRRHLAYAERLAGSRSLPLPRQALRLFFERMRSSGYPSVGHSEEYRNAYHPAYRVVLSHLLRTTPAGP